MNRKEFLEKISLGTILADGGMGSEIYNRGIFINRCFEQVNIESPELIKGIYVDYVNSGSEIITANTYGANRYKLSKFGIVDKLEEIIEYGLVLAKEAVDDTDTLVAGSIGPVGLEFCEDNYDKLKDIYNEQIELIIKYGADLIFFETFHTTEELLFVIDCLRELNNDIPVVAMRTFCFNVSMDCDEKEISLAAKKLDKSDADVIGINCSVGPQKALDLLKTFMKYTKKPVVILPNAGYPRNIEGRTMYLANAEMFGNYAARFIECGASLIGGCCGTTPEYISQMARVIRQFNPKKRKIKIFSDDIENKGLKPLPLSERSPLAEKLGEKIILSMEVFPPKDANTDKLIETAIPLKETFDALNLPDGPRASARMATATASYMIEKYAKIETITHLCCRDKNLLGLQAELLSMHALGLRNVLAITGDPPKLGNYPNATAVFDVDSIGLVKIISNLNKGLDMIGEEIGVQTSFVVGVGVNPGADNIDREIERLEEKVDAGAHFIMTQPVYNPDQFMSFINKTSHIRIPVIAGISPLTSYKAAEFQHNEIPGMQISDKILDMLKTAKNKKEARRIGIDLSEELIEKILPYIGGFYFMAMGNIGRKSSLTIIDEMNLSKKS